MSKKSILKKEYKNIKAIIFFVFCFSVLGLSAYAIELQGGVTYTVDSARDYLEDGQPSGIRIPTDNYRLKADNVEKMVTSYNPSGDVIAVTVQYINEPTKAYIYKNDYLIYVETYDKPVNTYPHRGYRYDLDGNLVLSSLTVSKNEMFRFSPDGKLIAHSVNNVIYDENGKIIGRGK